MVDFLFYICSIPMTTVIAWQTYITWLSNTNAEKARLEIPSV